MKKGLFFDFILRNQRRMVPGILVVALMLSVLWIVTSKDRFEPSVTSIALLATLLSIFIDKNLSRIEKRQEIIKGLIYEMTENFRILESPRYKVENITEERWVFQKFTCITAQAAVVSGIFLTSRDQKLYRVLNMLIQNVNDINRRVEFVEQTYMSFTDPKNVIQLKTKLLTGSGMTTFVSSLKTYGKFLVSQYWDESGLFQDSDLVKKLEI